MIIINILITDQFIDLFPVLTLTIIIDKPTYTQFSKLYKQLCKILRISQVPTTLGDGTYGYNGFVVTLNIYIEHNKTIFII